MMTMNEEFSITASNLSALTDADSAVILTGSAARSCRTEQSDIDLLFIATEKVSDLPVIPGYHIKFSTESDFMRRLNEGEDFEAWCVRFGVTLIDRGVWARITAASEGIWPRWEIKVVHGIRRLFLASQQFEIGDNRATREELIFVLGHISRGLLLKAGTFPLSRPELAQQVRQLGYPHLAAIHERLRMSDSPSKSDLSLGLQYAKKLLVHLDKEGYGKIAQDTARVIRAKELRRAQLHMSRNGHPSVV